MSTRRQLLATAAAVPLVALAARMPAHAADIPTKPEPGTFKMGIEPWLGYGPWRIAESKGLFAKEGLEKVDIVNFTQDADINSALASGQLDGANIATHTALAMAAAGLPIKIVMLEDVSLKADAIIAGKDITQHQGPEGQAGRLRAGHDQRHPAQLRALAERHDDRRHPEGADAGRRCRLAP